MGEWLREQMGRRPIWMNALLLFCAYMALIYLPWDIFIKPLEEDAEVWFGLTVTGWAAKILAFPHWAVMIRGLLTGDPGLQVSYTQPTRALPKAKAPGLGFKKPKTPKVM